MEKIIDLNLEGNQNYTGKKNGRKDNTRHDSMPPFGRHRACHSRYRALKSIMKPNIFDIATKELTQDAFITWLLQFADDKYLSIDESLSRCGKYFVKRMIQKQISDFNESICTVEANRQWENIDVWAKVNDKYFIVIEDKTYTSHHSNQLKRYKAFAENWCERNNYYKPICIYLKTGNESQSSLNQIRIQGFSIFSRIDFIEVLENFEGISNNIYRDFHERLVRLEKLNNEYQDKPIINWNGNDWQGFYQFLETQLQLVNWNYVNNSSGGFWNAVLNWDYWRGYPTYVQIEESKLCFKISTNPSDMKIPSDMNRKDIRNQFHHLIMSKANQIGLNHIRRPNRLGNGKYMTVAIVDKENWLGDGDSILDKNAAVKRLKEYVKFLKEIII
jgi:hypothetical protein